MSGAAVSSVVIDVRADFAALSRDMRGLQGAVDTGFGRIESRARSGVESVEKLGQSFGRLNAMVGALGGFMVLDRALGSIVEKFQAVPAMGFQFANQMEVMQVGMAGTLSSMATMDGKALSFNQALEVSSRLTEQLAEDAAKTAANVTELVNGFNAMLGPGLQARMTIDQIRQLSTVGINAVKSMGLESAQVVQEMRSIISGNITSDSQLAVAIGITNKDVNEIKQKGGDLFKFLMDRLQGFAESSGHYAKTLPGLVDAAREVTAKAAAEGMEPLREAAKKWLDGFNEAMADDGQRRQFVDGLKSISSGLAHAGDMAGAAGRALYQHRDLLMSLAGAYTALKVAQMGGAVGGAIVQPVKNIIDWRQSSKADELAADTALRRAQMDRTAAMAELERSRATSVRAAQTVVALAADREKLALDAALSQAAVRQIEESRSLAMAAAMRAEADNAAKVAAAELAAAEQARDAETIKSTASYQRLQAAKLANAAASADVAAATAIEAAEQQRLTAAQSHALAMSNALAETDARLAAAQAAAAETAVAQTAATSKATAAASAATLAQQQHAAAMTQASIAARAAALGMGMARNALALLGGPLGVATLAIGALIFYWDDLAAAAGNAAAKNEQAAKRIQAALAKASVPLLKQELKSAQQQVDEYGKKWDLYVQKGKITAEATAEHQRRITAAVKLRDEARDALAQGLEKESEAALKPLYDKYPGEKKGAGEGIGGPRLKAKFDNRLQSYLEDGKHQTKDEKYQQALEEEKLAFQGAVAGLDQGSAEYQNALKRHNARTAELKKNYEKEGRSAADKAARQAERDMEQVSDLINKSAGISPTYNNKLAVLQKVFGQGKIDIDQYRAAVEKLIMTETDLGKEAEKLQKRQREVMAGMAEQAAEQTAANQRELQGFGRGDQTRRETEAIDQLFKKALESKRRLAEDLDLKLIDPVAYNAALAQIDASTAAMVASQRAHFDAMREAAGDWTAGASRAMENYADRAGNIAGSMEEVFGKAFGGMEDALTKFVTTGKLSFTDLANSVIEDLIRIQIRAAMAGILSTGMNSFMAGLFKTSGPAAPIVAGTSPIARADGGPVFGPGTATSDSIPAMLSNGEFVVKAAAVDHYGVNVLHALNAKRLATGGGVGRASANAAGFSVPSPAAQKDGGGRLSVRVEVVNKSSQPVQATASQPQFDGREWVIGVVLDDLRRGGPVRDAVSMLPRR
ncbi:phage tail tape measure protein [Chromobacterium haemolyticum]|uniref:Phage tail tape measure protein n=1 Tax=Chromobacterium haemolyticum TaxID=394935 RepID=A0A1W0CD08_9NEIS|nr:phage tail tape measure protein [Chromobacterium haemolyticum]OQS32595.1 phage tail tape measure protein [Chromobacterium haemolyticum]